MTDSQYIAILDIGSTNIHASIYSEDGQLLDHTAKRLSIIDNLEGQIEIDPQLVFSESIDILKKIA
ncbi:hypothetical protein HZS_4792 [Henneguya salminicola]|nr:hypothetical protein HZS_4792 [Henneguya salminicola]